MTKKIRARVFLYGALLALSLPFVGAKGPMSVAHAQADLRPVPQVPDGPLEFDVAENMRIRVDVVTRGLSHPWAIAFLPDGDMLVTERAGRVRIIRKGRLDPTPVATIEVATTFFLSGLMDIALHPRFAENKFVYLTYNKAAPDRGQIVTLARGRWDGSKLVEIRDLFVSDSRIGASRLAFGRDGFLYWAVGGPGPGPADTMVSQDPMHHAGKILRLRDDGSVPPNNPFVGRAGYKPEIYSLGHRNQLGLTLNPITGDIWESEMGPNGGDEVNIILPGRNYGWPIVSFGRWYEGDPVSANPYRDGMEPPILYWVPAIATTGMTFYTGDKFPQWKGNLFVGGMRHGEVLLTGQIQRIVFNSRWQELRRESMLGSLQQRMRDVREGPDGFLYVLTDEDAAVLLRITPAPAQSIR